MPSLSPGSCAHVGGDIVSFRNLVDGRVGSCQPRDYVEVTFSPQPRFKESELLETGPTSRCYLQELEDLWGPLHHPQSSELMLEQG